MHPVYESIFAAERTIRIVINYYIDLNAARVHAPCSDVQALMNMRFKLNQSFVDITFSFSHLSIVIQ